MLETVALVAAIALIVILLQVRQILSLVFPHVSVKMIKNAQAPESVGDLFAGAHNELLDLGFKGPHWLLRMTKPDSLMSIPLSAVYHHPADKSLVWLYPPIEAELCNRLLSYWTTRLVNGRIITTQAFDPSWECMATSEMPGKTVNGHTLAEQWEQHRQYRDSFGLDPDDESISDRAIVWQAGEATNQHHHRLVERGRLRLDSDGAIRPRIRFALIMLWLRWRRPKCMDTKRPQATPLARQVWLSRIAEKTKQLAPSTRAQGTLFGISLLLFSVLGFIFWDLSIAVLLLAAIVIHELGHYITMRVFGLRKFQLMALPMISGVTIGYDDKPNAAHHAWISLMGPLPGIIIGWMLAAWWQFYGDSSALSSWIFDAAVVLLLLNYLNLLPVLPLDGGRVMLAVLPPRWIPIHAILVLLVCSAGALLAYWLEIYVLVILAGLLLSTLGSYFRVAKIIRKIIPHSQLNLSQDRPTIIKSVLEYFEKISGPCFATKTRLNQADQVLTLLDAQAMNRVERSLLGCIMILLLSAPVVLILGGHQSKDNPFVDAINFPYLNHEEKHNDTNTLIQLAESMSTIELINDMVTPATSPGNVPQELEDNISTTEQRLGVLFPVEIESLYKVWDGVPTLGVLSLDQLQPAFKDQSLLIAEMVSEGRISVYPTEGENPQKRNVSVEQAQQWIYFGYDSDLNEHLFLDIGPNGTNHPDYFITSNWGSPSGYLSMKDWLETRWRMRRSSNIDNQ